jgi:hypothetical protein
VQGVNVNNLASWENQPGDTVDVVVTPGSVLTVGGTSAPAGLTITGKSPQEWQTVTVKYTYLATAAVPEPSGQWLSYIVGAAMAVFMIGRRMRMAA